MKIKLSILAAVFALLAFSFAACSSEDSGGGDSGSENPGGNLDNGDSGSENSSVAVTGVSITDKSVTFVFVNGTLKLSASVVPSNASNQTVTWISSNPDAASVDNSGLVTGKSANDSVTITVTADGNFSDSITLKIIDKSALTSKIDSVVITGPSIIASNGAAELVASPSGTNLDSSKVTYKWEVASGPDYAGLSESTSETVTLTGKNTTEADAKIVVKVTASYDSDGVTTTAENTVEITVAGTKTTVKDEILSVSMSGKEAVDPGKTIELTATPIYNGKPEITYSWEITSGADYGTLSVLAPDTVSFKAKNPSTISTQSVTVKVTASDGENSVSDEITITVDKLPSSTKSTDLSNIAISEITSAESKSTEIATLTSDGTTLSVTSVSVGSTSITVSGKMKTGTVSGTISVTVADDGSLTLGRFIETSRTNYVTEIEIESATESVAVGETISFKAVVTPIIADNRSVTWSSSDPAVATVSDTGVVTGIKEGTAEITAAANDGSGVKESITVEVKDTGKVIGTVY